MNYKKTRKSLKKCIFTMVFLFLLSGTLIFAQSNQANKRILIAYFSVPEKVNTTGIDANAGASVVVKNGAVLGNTHYMAQVIQQAVGGDLFEIKTVQSYPLDHQPLLDFASAEQRKKARPVLSTKIANLNEYDIIFLGYPNWWADLPMPLYSFLESQDLNGKTIIPFCPHGGSGFSNTIKSIASLQPKATVLREGLTISRNSVARAENEIKAWVTQMLSKL